MNRKGKALFAWSAIPPSKDYVALGMVFTTSETPPPVESMCCVLKRILKPTEFKYVGMLQASCWNKQIYCCVYLCCGVVFFCYRVYVMLPCNCCRGAGQSAYGPTKEALGGPAVVG